MDDSGPQHQTNGVFVSLGNTKTPPVGIGGRTIPRAGATTADDDPG
jgi:hypothetical protein